MNHQRQRVHATQCPHCRGRALIRSSKMITPLTRQIWYACENEEECGHRFVAQLSILHSVQPSACPSPEIDLPIRAAVILAPLTKLPAPETTPADFAGLIKQLDAY